MSQTNRYVIITPIKDEAQFVKRTLKSVAAQTVQPYQWVIVDDGSQDGTLELVSSFAANYPWIRVHSLMGERPRQPGSAVIHAFRAGLRLLDDLAFDFIVKLDGDVDIPPHYFEELLTHFSADPKLGIASGAYVEQHNGELQTIVMPHYHAAGASKVVRADCFTQIGGFVTSRGWDTVDEIRAQTCGWTTKHIPDLLFQHLKPEGSGIGYVRTHIMHGEIYYLTGGGKLFLFLKAAHLALNGKPPIAGAIAFIMGFFQASLRRRARLVDEQEAKHYRDLLNARIKSAVVRGIQRIGSCG